MGIIKWLDQHLEEVFLSVFLLVLILLTSANVILRYIFNSGLTWSDEICKYCLIFSGFISISYWIRHKTGICVDALVQVLPKQVQKILGIITQVLVLLFFLWMFRGSINVLNSVAKSGQVSGTLQISMVYIYTAPVIGFGLAVVRVIQVMIAIGTPVAVVFGGMASLPSLFNSTFPYTAESAIRSMVSGLDSFTLLAVPLFMLSGIIMARGGISEKLFNFFAYFIGNRTAGMPCAVIITCMFYGAISGSSPATVSAVGAMTIPFLISLGYDKVFSTAIVTVAGGLGVIIPPSISYIVFSSASNASPSSLFIGGVIPGILIGIALMICAYLYCKKSGEDKEKLKENYERIRSIGFGSLLKESFFALLTPVIILGSIYGGVASPTEAAAISVIYALVISIWVYKTLKVSELGKLLVEGSKTYVTILFIISAATAFGRALTMLQYPQVISAGILGSISSKTMVLLVMNLILLVFGMLLDNIPNIMILTPIFLPIATSIGMDPVHFGIMMTCNLAIGMVTPPMGINLYVASSMTGVPVLRIAKATIPFLLAFLVALAFITFVPEISLILPGLA